MQLIKSPVVFNQEEHTYHLGDVELKGITGMLNKKVFPDKYKEVPPDILQKAAQRGSYIHMQCELVDTLGITPENEEALNYIQLRDEHGLQTEESEYLVSDEKHFATCIDKVYRTGERSFHLADIKTTYKLDTEYVRWQLSVNAYLFELQNKGAVVDALFAIWLREDKKELVEVQRIPNEVIIALLDSETNDTEFVNPYPAPVTKADLPAVYQEMEDTIAQIDYQVQYWTERKKALTDGVMKEMVKAGVYNWKGEHVHFIRKKESIRKTFDKEAFEKDYPGVYDKYLKESPVAGSVTLKII
ncbi:hypothetical protein ABLT32_13305 [Bacteroides pyogenes]|uniref:hypothetical protein n=1 Tax=Bacteroides pyogenes TaxID=310300 RepID=UPI004063188C